MGRLPRSPDAVPRCGRLPWSRTRAAILSLGAQRDDQRAVGQAGRAGTPRSNGAGALVCHRPPRDLPDAIVVAGSLRDDVRAALDVLPHHAQEAGAVRRRYRGPRPHRAVQGPAQEHPGHPHGPRGPSPAPPAGRRGRRRGAAARLDGPLAVAAAHRAVRPDRTRDAPTPPEGGAWRWTGSRSAFDSTALKPRAVQPAAGGGA